MKNHGFELKIEQEMNDYLSCKIEFSEDRDKIWIGQLHLMKKICNVFGPIVEKMAKYKTPGSLHVGIIRPNEDNYLINKEDFKLLIGRWNTSIFGKTLETGYCKCYKGTF